MATLYHWARCSTCRQLRQALRSAGTPVQERDFFADPLSEEELDQLARLAGGVRELFSGHSPSARALEDRLATMTDKELRSLMLAEPRLLRRPILVTDDGQVLIGRKASGLGEQGK
jgi:Spx/MgsR family transcriptional regulator